MMIMKMEICLDFFKGSQNEFIILKVVFIIFTFSLLYWLGSLQNVGFFPDDFRIISAQVCFMKKLF